MTWSLRWSGPGIVEFSQTYPNSAVKTGERRRMSPPYNRLRSYPRAGPPGDRSSVTMASSYTARVQGPPIARWARARRRSRCEAPSHGSSHRCSSRIRAEFAHRPSPGRTSVSCCQTRCSCRVAGPNERGTHAYPTHPVACGASRRPIADRTIVSPSSEPLSKTLGWSSKCPRQFSESGPVASACAQTWPSWVSWPKAGLALAPTRTIATRRGRTAATSNAGCV